jgi:hypothetical protein
MKFAIEQQLAQDIVNYLVKRPFEEVAPLIDKLSQMQPIAETEATNHQPESALTD